MGDRIDRTPKPCHHKQVTHQHGTYACYQLDQCRCHGCAFARSDYNTRLRRANAHGRSRLVPADPVREHVDALRATGLGLRLIGERTGVPRSWLRRLYHERREDGSVRPPVRRVDKGMAERVLRYTSGGPQDVAGGVPVDSIGVRRRLRALVALGWSIQRLADESGIEHQAFRRAMRGERVSATTYRVVASLYERIGDRPPVERNFSEKQSASRSRNHAARAGWAVPAAWDEEALDDPDAAEPVRADAVIDRSGADLDDFVHLVGGGVHVEEAARRLGVKLQTIDMSARRLGRRDVLVLISLAKAA